MKTGHDNIRPTNTS